MDNPVQGKLLVVISVAIWGAILFFGITDLKAYGLYGLAIILFILGIINWSER